MIKKAIAIILLLAALVLSVFILQGGVIFPHIVGPIVLLVTALALIIHKGKKA